MSDLYFDFGHSSLNKVGEELSGDSLVFNRNPQQVVIVLSDGLGSGVKANILSTLTTKIISVMLEKGAGINEVTETLSETLPFCKVRKLAYSTFSIAQCFFNGDTYLAECDNPPTFFINEGKVQHLNYQIREIGEKRIKEIHLKIKEGDWLVFVSDGEVHAGIGGLWNLGWNWDRIATYLEMRSSLKLSAQQLADDLINVAYKLYQKKPGDDATVGVLKIRERRLATLLIGVPLNKEDDPKVVHNLMNSQGKKIVCGGTTGSIVARELNREIDVDMKTATVDIPPIGIIKGLDLVTEGTITLMKALKLLKDQLRLSDLKYKNDGASRLAFELSTADSIRVILGRSINPAHQNPDLPVNLGLKAKFVEEIAELLKSRDKEVVISYY
ncbi:MAG: hypothetical protein AMJ42_00445 [Deltaproteobacteria bacterium DG_8]|nr:MAG: hypothetical protein AMJ42_00445 [Deltaproteobacteria bacterium DG_8]